MFFYFYFCLLKLTRTNSSQNLPLSIGKKRTSNMSKLAIKTDLCWANQHKNGFQHSWISWEANNSTRKQWPLCQNWDRPCFKGQKWVHKGSLLSLPGLWKGSLYHHQFVRDQNARTDSQWGETLPLQVLWQEIIRSQAIGQTHQSETRSLVGGHCTQCWKGFSRFKI